MPSSVGSNIFGGITFVLVVALALAAIAVIIYGRYLKQRRIAGEKELVARREAAHVDAAPPAPASEFETTVEPVAAPPAPAPNVEEAPEIVASEPIEAAETPRPVPRASTTKPAPAPASSTDGDITQLKGLGPKLAATLAELGYTRLDQIAELTPDEAADLDARLGTFQGRMTRDRWIEQAKLLVAGDRAGYEAAFGKLG